MDRMLFIVSYRYLCFLNKSVENVYKFAQNLMILKWNDNKNDFFYGNCKVSQCIHSTVHSDLVTNNGIGLRM